MNNRLVTVAGAGGMGKTTLATAVARRVADKFPDGVWFADLVPISEPGRVPGAVAHAAGLHLDRTDDPAARLGELIGDRRLLLILDNCEHLIDSASDVIDAVLERSSHAHVLATSRERLGLLGEHVVNVGPLASTTHDAAAVELLHRLLESIKQYATEHWGVDADRHRDRHLAWVRGHLLEPTLEQRLMSLHQMADHAQHSEDFRAAIRHAMATDDLDLAADLVVAGAYQARASDGPLAGEHLALVDEMLAVTDLSDRARVEVQLASALAALGTRDLERMNRDSQAAVVSAQQADCPEVMAMAQIVASWRPGMADPQKGLDLLQQASETAMGAGLSRLADAAVSNSASFLSLLGRDDEAAAVAREVLARAAEPDYPAVHASASLAAAVALTNPTEAWEANQRSAAMWEGTGQTTRWFDAVWESVIYASLTDPTGALESLEEALTRAKRTGTETGLPDLLLAPATLAYRLGDHDRCRQLLADVRADGRPTAGFPLTTLYRRLREQVGAGGDPTPGGSQVALDRAHRWMSGLLNDASYG